MQSKESCVFFWAVTYLLAILIGFGAVAFSTLLERKLLGLSQVRLGPNKVTIFGVLQPVADGIKLLFKQLFLVTLRQRLLFLRSPVVVFCLFIVIWAWLLPWNRSGFELKYSSLIFFSLLGVGGYAIIMTGWSRIRRFAKLGRLRGILQNLSFEVALILVFISVLMFFHRFSIKREICIKEELILVWVSIWLLLSLIERNRAPFDLLEGERELISGFNIEMGSLTFVYLFLREYGMLIILSFVAGVALYGGAMVNFIIFLSFLLFIRSCFPRVRYDVIIRIMWEGVLPFGVLFFTLLYVVV